MRRVVLMMILALATLARAKGQESTLPVKEWDAANDNPFVLYLSGDGGINNFSKDLCNAINKAGYCIAAVNAKSYFWDKKTPAQVAADLISYLGKRFQNRRNQELVLAGYSFGADVLPFIVRLLSQDIKSKLVSVLLVSPSTSTDFQVHLADMLGGNTKRSMDVVAEVNRMESPRTITFFGSDENEFPVQLIHLKNYHNEVLPGGHRYYNKTDELAKIMVSHFK